MAKVLYEENGWIVQQDGERFSVSYTPPGNFSSGAYTGIGESIEAAILDLPKTITCLPACDRFMEALRNEGLMKPRTSESETSAEPPSPTVNQIPLKNVLRRGKKKRD